MEQSVTACVRARSTIARAQSQVVLVWDQSAFERVVREPSNANHRETALHLSGSGDSGYE